MAQHLASGLGWFASAVWICASVALTGIAAPRLCIQSTRTQTCMCESMLSGSMHLCQSDCACLTPEAVLPQQGNPALA